MSSLSCLTIYQYCAEIFDGVEPDNVGSMLNQILNLFPLLSRRDIPQPFELDEKCMAFKYEDPVGRRPTSLSSILSRIPAAISSPANCLAFEICFKLEDFIFCIACRGGVQEPGGAQSPRFHWCT